MINWEISFHRCNNKREHSFERAFSSTRSHKEPVIDPCDVGYNINMLHCCQMLLEDEIIKRMKKRRKCVIKHRQCDPLFFVDDIRWRRWQNEFQKTIKMKTKILEEEKVDTLKLVWKSLLCCWQNKQLFIKFMRGNQNMELLVALETKASRQQHE